MHPLGHDRAFCRRADAHGEGEIADPLDAELGIARAERKGDLAAALRRDRCGAAEVEVAGHEHQLGAPLHDLDRGVRPLRLVGLGVGGHELDLLAEHTARRVDIVDRQDRALVRVVVRGDEARQCDSGADHDRIVVGCRLTEYASRRNRSGQRDGARFPVHVVSPIFVDGERNLPPGESLSAANQLAL